MAACTSGRLSHFLECHSGATARIADRNGADGLWISSLAVSTLMGRRDANEVCWTEMVMVSEWVTSSSDLPVLLDLDSGYGDYNIARLAASHAARAGVAGVCIEDKTFPKTNSFRTQRLPLMPAGQLVDTIRATRDRVGDSIAIVARTEVMIYNGPVDEAVDRASAFVDAGADAVIAHSKSSSIDETIAFATALKRSCPVIAIPTTFAADVDVHIKQHGIDAVIWANQALRAQLLVYARIQRSLLNVEQLSTPLDMMSLESLFDLLDYGALDNQRSALDR